MNQGTKPTMGEILKKEFMEPFGLSAYAVSKGAKMPTSRILEIINGRRRVTVDTSIRLGRFFNVSDRYFLNLQNDIDFRKAEETKKEDYASIKPLHE